MFFTISISNFKCYKNLTLRFWHKRLQWKSAIWHKTIHSLVLGYWWTSYMETTGWYRRTIGHTLLNSGAAYYQCNQSVFEQIYCIMLGF